MNQVNKSSQEEVPVIVQGNIWVRLVGKPLKNVKRPLPSPSNQAKKK